MSTHNAYLCAAVGMVAYISGRILADWFCRRIGL